MRTQEEKKIIRGFSLAVVWILFIACTLSGLIFAAEQTAYMNDGTEIETVKIDNVQMKKQ